jgi:hypothetical protein
VKRHTDVHGIGWRVKEPLTLVVVWFETAPRPAEKFLNHTRDFQRSFVPSAEVPTTTFELRAIWPSSVRVRQMLFPSRQGGLHSS